MLCSPAHVCAHTTQHENAQSRARTGVRASAMEWAGMVLQVAIFKGDVMSAGGHHASMKTQDPFCWGRCQPRLRRGPEPVFVSSVRQRGVGLIGLRLTPAPADSGLFTK